MHKPTQFVAEFECKIASESLRKEQKRLDRRSELLNKALAEDVRINDQQKERSSRYTPAASSSQSSISSIA